MNKPTDYEAELEAINKKISELQICVFSRPNDAEKLTKFVYLLYHRASLSGKFQEFEIAEIALDDAIGHLGPAPDLYLLKANLDFKFHRLVEAKHDLQSGPGLLDSSQGRTLQADIAFQEGRYDEARREYENLIEQDRTWDHLARLAYLQGKMGHIAGAEQLYIDAENEITAKEMRSFAWVELQRGLLHFTHGRFEDAWAHYTRSDRAYTGYWLVDEHIAELLGAQGRYDEAVALYEKVIGRVPRPELQQALGELYIVMGKPEQAEPWHKRALTAYIESTQRGHVHYYHHLADFFADVRNDATEALKWARRDLNLRKNFSTLAAVAWALFLDGQFAEALEAINQALASGVREADMYFKAAIIYRAVGKTREENQYMQLAAQVNPEFNHFHVHR